MTNLKGIKNIIFDLGNVVLDIDLNLTYKAFHALGYMQGVEFLNKYKQEGAFGDIERGIISKEEFTKVILADCKDGASAQQVVDAWCALILNYKKERIACILALNKQYRTFLLSNTNSIHIENCGHIVPIVGSLDQLFEKVYYSHEVQMRKPNADIYQHVLKDANIIAEETLFLDDSLANVEAAQALGIKSWHIEDADSWVEALTL